MLKIILIYAHKKSVVFLMSNIENQDFEYYLKEGKNYYLIMKTKKML